MSAPMQMPWSFQRTILVFCRQKWKIHGDVSRALERYSPQFKGRRFISIYSSSIYKNSVFLNILVKHNSRTQIRKYSFHGRLCWKCGKPSDLESQKFFCECGVVQSVRELSLFEIVGIEDSFDVEQSVLSQNYKEIQKLIHPDKHTLKSDEEKNLAEEQSSLVNKAYSTLVKPLNRALYMLERAGHGLEEDSSNVNQEFLMEIMEINEEIADAESPDALKPIEIANLERLQDNIKKLSKAFEKSDFVLAKQLVIELKYFTNIDEKIKEIYRGHF